MKTKLSIILFCLMAICLTSCKKEDPIETGSIQFVNNSKYPFSITVKGNTALSFTLNGQYSTTKTVEVGYYNVHIKQNSGYLFYPTEKDYQFYVKSKQNQLVSFTN